MGEFSSSCTFKSSHVQNFAEILKNSKKLPKIWKINIKNKGLVIGKFAKRIWINNKFSQCQYFGEIKGMYFCKVGPLCEIVGYSQNENPKNQSFDKAYVHYCRGYISVEYILKMLLFARRGGWGSKHLRPETMLKSTITHFNRLMH